VGPIELELKGVVPDPTAVRAALLAAGATLTFRGLLADRRYDRDGTLRAKDEVLRTRAYMAGGTTRRAQLGWKGPTARSAEGYKVREERELDVTAGEPAGFLEALGFAPVHAIDRWIEVYHLGSAEARIEWYPRMDVLIEVEGDTPGIERLISITGLPRPSFTSEPLDVFTARYDAAHPAAPSEVAREGWAGPNP
jgi:adenylate cyclase class IV